MSRLVPEGAATSGRWRWWAAASDRCTGSDGCPGVGVGTAVDRCTGTVGARTAATAAAAAAGRSARDRCTSKRMSQLSPEVAVTSGRWRRRRQTGAPEVAVGKTAAAAAARTKTND